jgi:hypothetical protein
MTLAINKETSRRLAHDERKRGGIAVSRLP